MELWGAKSGLYAGGEKSVSLDDEKRSSFSVLMIFSAVQYKPDMSFYLIRGYLT